ncbi:uncharacterized protein AB675_5601 [Cyphellophora attinorum]|uniref:Uncharacterized protein n=1 Tax=Cyphellophora attinorum TaxID=1664694 RepID=A0A0N0NNY2_9EURO|nr:uncharacterized protein AB675_5601 [Phialophora attinorum]KPI42111.1 hypothetical protein AB675_5601 [Phialophora attinorum]
MPLKQLKKPLKADSVAKKEYYRLWNRSEELRKGDNIPLVVAGPARVDIESHADGFVEMFRNNAPTLDDAELASLVEVYVNEMNRVYDARATAAAAPKQVKGHPNTHNSESTPSMNANAVLPAKAFAEPAIVVAVFRARADSISITYPLLQGEMQVLCPFTAIPMSALPTDSTKLLRNAAQWIVQGLPTASQVNEATAQESDTGEDPTTDVASSELPVEASGTKDLPTDRLFSGGARPGCSENMREGYIAHHEHMTYYIKSLVDLKNDCWDRRNVNYNHWLRELTKAVGQGEALPLLVVVVAQKEDDKPKGETYGVLKRPRSQADVEELEKKAKRPRSHN